jgi:hypothetical protein
MQLRPAFTASNQHFHPQERWLGKSGQAAKWSFCLKVASMATEQEIK